MRRAKKDVMAGYEPLTWEPDSELDRDQQQTIEWQRRDIWRHGIRDPLLTQMAFEFAYLICVQRAAKAAGS
jgi:hypothetical protein